MPEKSSKKNMIALLIATSFSVLILFVPLSSGLFGIVSVIGSTESNNTPQMQSVSVEDYDVIKNCTTDRSKKPTSIEYPDLF